MELSGLLLPMSYFAGTLGELLKQNKMNARRLSTLSGVSQPTLSRFLNDDQAWISKEDMAAIAGAVSHDPLDQARLVVARLRDECTGPGSQLVEIRLKGRGEAVLKESAPIYKTPLSAETNRQFDIIRNAYLQDGNVREVIEGLANLLSKGDCRIEGES